MSAKVIRYFLEDGQILQVATVEECEKHDQRLTDERQQPERPAGWEQRVLIPSTHFLHRLKHIELLKRRDPILYHGRLTFAIVAACTGLHPSTVSHWYQLDQKRRLNPELLVLLQYYGGKSLNEAFCWLLPSGAYCWDTTQE